MHRDMEVSTRLIKVCVPVRAPTLMDCARSVFCNERCYAIDIEVISFKKRILPQLRKSCVFSEICLEESNTDIYRCDDEGGEATVGDN